MLKLINSNSKRNSRIRCFLVKFDKLPDACWKPLAWLQDNCRELLDKYLNRLSSTAEVVGGMAASTSQTSSPTKVSDSTAPSNTNSQQSTTILRSLIAAKIPELEERKRKEEEQLKIDIEFKRRLQQMKLRKKDVEIPSESPGKGKISDFDNDSSSNTLSSCGMHDSQNSPTSIETIPWT